MNYETLEEKVDFLNNLVDGTLVIAYYTLWELSSYGKNSLFSTVNGRFGLVREVGFSKCINRAFEIAVKGYR